MLSIKNKKFLATVISFSLFIIMLIPVLSFGASTDNPDVPTGVLSNYLPLIQCGNSTGTVPILDPVTRQPTGKTEIGLVHPCDFSDAVATVNRIINWIISIAGVIFTVSCIWGGFLYATSGQKPANKDKAKTILWSTFSGFIIILIAWVVIHLILVTFIDTSASKPGNKNIFNFIGLISN